MVSDGASSTLTALLASGCPAAFWGGAGSWGEAGVSEDGERVASIPEGDGVTDGQGGSGVEVGR